MATKTTKTTRKTTLRKQCTRCGDSKVETKFYNSYSKLNRFDKKMPICKECLVDIYEEFLEDNEQDENTAIYLMCRALDIYYDPKYVEIAMTNKNSTLSDYMSKINSLKQLKDFTFKDSLEYLGKGVETNKVIPDELIEEWGKEFSYEEIQMLEKESELLKEDINVKHNSTKQYLKLAVIFFVRSKIAGQQDRLKESKEYFDMYSKAMKDGEFTPSALSKNSVASNLSSFAEASLMVEECVDVVELHKILPKYMGTPKDEVDKVIWYLVAYIERVLGRPVSTYEQIYEFYQEMEKTSGGVTADGEEAETGMIPNLID